MEVDHLIWLPKNILILLAYFLFWKRKKIEIVLLVYFDYFGERKER